MALKITSKEKKILKELGARVKLLKTVYVKLEKTSVATMKSFTVADKAARNAWLRWAIATDKFNHLKREFTGQMMD